jgi:hypothetical protein
VAKPPPRRLYCIDEDLGNFQFGIDLIFHGQVGWPSRGAHATECQRNIVAGVSTLRAPHFPEIGPTAMSCVKSLMAEAAPNTDRENRDRGESRDSSPPTPPDVRVRIRRFGGLSRPRHRDGSQAKGPQGASG